MLLTTDHDGKAWIEVQAGGVTARFAIESDSGIAFGPYRQVEIGDARIEHVVEVLLASFGTQAVSVSESA